MGIEADNIVLAPLIRGKTMDLFDAITGRAAGIGGNVELIPSAKTAVAVDIHGIQIESGSFVLNFNFSLS